MTISASVVVLTHNRPDQLGETLEHLLKARTRTDFELLIVDDGSSPPVSIQESGVRVVRTPGVERSKARNLGAAFATREIVVFIDDDITVSPDFVEEHQRAALEFKGALCVGGIFLPDEMSRTPFGRFRRLIEEPSQALPRGFVEESNFCTAANMSMPRATFLALGGFDPAILSGEDQDLALRFSQQGGKIVFIPEANVLHRDSNAHIASYCRRHEWGAQAMAPFLRRYPERAENRKRLRLAERFWSQRSVRDKTALLACSVLSQPSATEVVLRSIGLLEHSGAGDGTLFRLYQIALGLHLFKGFRRGLAKFKTPPSLPSAIRPELSVSGSLGDGAR